MKILCVVEHGNAPSTRLRLRDCLDYYAGLGVEATVVPTRRSSVTERLRVLKLSTAAVLGGGPLGLEWAHALREQGVRVTIVERFPRLLPRALDEAASHLVVTRLRHAGIEVVLGEEVISAYPAAHGGIGAVSTNTGRAVACEFVAVAMGVVPNTELLAQTPVELVPSGAVRVS